MLCPGPMIEAPDGEDAATIILDNLAKNGPFSRRRVGLALPAGMRNVKHEVAR